MVTVMVVTVMVTVVTVVMVERSGATAKLQVILRNGVPNFPLFPANNLSFLLGILYQHFSKTQSWGFRLKGPKGMRP